MLGIGKWSPQRKAALAAALALLLTVPGGISERTQPLVTGHSTFFNGEGFDPCLASIAGILRTQVMWFNDQILAERYGGKGTYIYVSENGSEDPRVDPLNGGRRGLYSDGVFYDFIDPNGIHWHIDELYMEGREVVVGDPLSGATPYVEAPRDKNYVWVVELSDFPIHDQFAGDPNPATNPNAHDLYNFLVIVDTCRFHRKEETNFNGDKQNSDKTYDFNITHEEDVLDPGHGHQAGTGVHTHESFMADIWVGQKPIIVPSGLDPQGAQWESEWAAGTAQGQASNSYPGRPDPVDPENPGESVPDVPEEEGQP